MKRFKLAPCRWLAVVLILAGVLLGKSAPAAAQDQIVQDEADSTGQAGLVIVDGSGETRNYCVDLPADASGWDLLVGAGVAVNSEPSAMGQTICAINGVGCFSPNESCFCQCQGSPCVYWSYWTLDADGAWVYSNLGASSAKVQAGDVQGWVWGDGTTGSAPEPPEVTFAQICAVGGESIAADADVTATEAASLDTQTQKGQETATATPAPTSAPATVAATEPVADVQSDTAPASSFPWSVLLMLAPLPLLLLLMLWRRK